MMIAPCGLDCDTCPQKPEYCDGCHAETDHVWNAECEVRVCCKTDKGLDNCSLCDTFPCQRLTDFENDGWDHHTEAVQRLRGLKESQG